jgi:type I restriction enzyme M protein
MGEKPELLKKAAEHNFYNTSKFTFKKLTEDPNNIDKNLRNYINGFSKNARDIIEHFDFDKEISNLKDKDLLYQLIQKFNDIDLHPDEVSNHEMGTIFEELIRKFAEQSNETAGEHFTPREIIRLMVRLIITGNGDITKENIIRKVYDPACGTGGMLTIAKEEIEKRNDSADVFLYGQELNDKTYAISKADMLIKGEEAENIKHGNTFTNDKLNRPEDTFHYMITNPPFGVSWKKVRDYIEEEEDRGSAGRFEAGTPRVSDGSLLFLQHMLSKMKKRENGGSRVGIVFNGSPLFTGDAGSGESEIRRWIIENDWLETIVGLPDELFYNTGINTYIWILSNNKHKDREGKVQMIDAREMYEDMKKSLGNKRHYISEDQISEIVDIYDNYQEGEYSKIFDNEFFGYRKITIERPKQLKIEITEEGIEALKDERTYNSSATDDKTRENLTQTLKEMKGNTYMDGNKFKEELKEKLKEKGDKIRGSLMRAVLRSFGEHDQDAEIITKSNGEAKADKNLRDYERVPLDEEIEDYFEREVKPHVPNAWINEDKTEVGYEINFTRYFYEYEELRDLDEIEEDIMEVKEETESLLGDILD